MQILGHCRAEPIFARNCAKISNQIIKVLWQMREILSAQKFLTLCFGNFRERGKLRFNFHIFM